MAARIKGASLINTITILREVLGPNRFRAIVATCPVETQQLIRRTLAAVEWIPLEIWAPFLQAIYDQVCRKDEQQFRRLMRAVCKRDFSTVYRIYLAHASPQTLLDQASSIWCAYFDSGTLTKDASSGGEGGHDNVTLQMRGLETEFPLFAITMHAYLEQLMVMAGAQRSTIQRAQEQFLDGKLSCDYVVNLGT